MNINEAKAYSEIYQYARSLEPVLNFTRIRTIDESMRAFNSSLVLEELTAYDQYVFKSEPIVAVLDMNILRSGRDPFKEWLHENNLSVAYLDYQTIQEGLWDSLKSASSSVANAAQKGAEYLGAGIKAVGGAALHALPGGDKIISFLKGITEGGSPIGIAQLLLDIIGAIPASYIGIPTDVVANLINAIIYFGRGMILNGAFSLFFAAMPGIGNWLKTAKYTFLKPFQWLAEIIRGVDKGDPALVRKAGEQMASLSNSKSFMEIIGKYGSSIMSGIKSVVEKLLSFFKKFLPESWVQKIEQWLTTNLTTPISSTQKGIKIAEEFVEKGGAKDLAKGGKQALADELATGAAKAKQGVELTTNTGAKAITKKAGTVLADEAADIATKVTGKINPKDLADMVLAENKKGIANLFGHVAQEPGLNAAQRELMSAFSRSPEVFIECQKLSKGLWKTIKAIAELSGGKRKLLKLSRLAMSFLRNTYKHDIDCFEKGVFGSFYNLANLYPDPRLVHESALYEAEGDDVDYQIPDAAVHDQTADTTANPDVDTQTTMKQLGGLQFKNADPATQAEAKKKIAENDKLGPCAKIEKQASTAVGNAYVNALLTQTPYGDATKIAPDQQQSQRFDQIVNTELKRIGVEPVHEFVYDTLSRMGTHERAKYIDIYDPTTNKISVTTTPEEEDQRFEDFIQEEVKRTGLPEARIRAIVNQTKKENHEMDQQIADTTAQQTNQ